MAARRALPARDVLPYILAQCASSVAGAMPANLMFDLPALQIATNQRAGPGQWISETIAIFSLIGAILGGLRHAPNAVPQLVALTTTAAYWFTASTSFANPAVTIARMFFDTFAGIAPASAPAFIAAQIIGAAIAAFLCGWVFANTAQDGLQPRPFAPR